MLSGFHNHAWLSWGTYGFCNVWLAMPSSQTICNFGVFLMCAAFLPSRKLFPSNLLYFNIWEIYCSFSKRLLMFLSALLVFSFAYLSDGSTCHVSIARCDFFLSKRTWILLIFIFGESFHYFPGTFYSRIVPYVKKWISWILTHQFSSFVHSYWYMKYIISVLRLRERDWSTNEMEC